MAKAWRKKSSGARSSGGMISSMDSMTSPSKALLEQCHKAFQYGHDHAALHAFDICIAGKSPMPQWVVEFIRKTIIESMAKSDASRRYAKDAIDFARYSAVIECRDKENLTWEQAYESASAKCAGKLHSGEAETFRKSYQAVARNMRRRGGAGRYWTYADTRKRIMSQFDMLERAGLLQRVG